MAMIIKVIFIFACSLFLNSVLKAQVTFQKTFGGISTDYAYSVQQTKDEGYIIAGFTTSFGEGNRDAYLIRTDVNGKTLWTKTYGESNTDYAWTVQQTEDDGYIFGAHSGSFGAGSHDVYLVKSDLSGNVIWSRVYGGSSADGAYSLQQTTDGGFIIGAHVNSFGAGQHDVYLIKINNNGDTLWTKTFGGVGEDRFREIHQTADGGFILVSETLSFGAGNSDVYLIKTDSIGNLLWTKTYGGGSSDYGYSVRQTSDGGYIIAGYTRSFGAAGTDVYIIKTDSSGNLDWAKTYGGSSNDYGYSIRQTTDGGYIVAGYTESFGVVGDVYLIRIDANGDLMWSKTFGGSQTDHGWSVRQTVDGGFIIAGFTRSFGSGNEDVYLIKTDRLGNSGCNETAAVTTVSNTATIVSNSTPTITGRGGQMNTAATIVNAAATIDSFLCRNNPTGIEQSDGGSDTKPHQYNLFQNYPNPFNPSTLIKYTIPAAGNVSLKIYDSLGRDILSLVNEYKQAGTYEVKFSAIGGSASGGDASALPSGIYFYKLQVGSPEGQSFIETKKMVLLR
ncbi:MAG: T9SS type A sorting domain-containing protein [Bacteroidetes bacterium]|nr:T9SS type A sorting domain-containing protein [Bacteroidota bacterium]